ncbi:MAG: glycosyltransferase family 2 protein [Spirochaetota bacterium]
MRTQFGVSLVVPVYNSAAFLPSTIAELTDYLAREFAQYELIMVEDGSVDESLSLLRAAAEKDTNVRLLIHENNLGQQQSLADGLYVAKNEIVLTVDADLPCALTDLRRIAELAYDGKELVFTRRRAQIHWAWWRRLGSKVANMIFRVIYPFQVQDIGCGLVAMRPSLIEKLRKRKKPVGLIKLDLLLVAESYIEVDIQNHAPLTSSYSFFKLLRLFWLMLTYRFRQ